MSKDIINCIYINNKDNSLRYKRVIYSRHEMFKNEYVKVEINYSTNGNDFLILSVPTIDREGVVCKTTHNNKDDRLRSFVIAKITDIPIGTFEIDTDESTEDEIIIYI